MGGSSGSASPIVGASGTTARDTTFGIAAQQHLCHFQNQNPYVWLRTVMMVACAGDCSLGFSIVSRCVFGGVERSGNDAVFIATPLSMIGI